MNTNERIARLKECDKLYFLTGKSPITDAEYDKEKDELQKLIPEHPYFNNVGVEIDAAHGTVVQHEQVMGSFQKSRDLNEFRHWLELLGKLPEFILTPKVDGLALSIHNANSSIRIAVTRGDGFKGIDVTKNIKFVDNVPKNPNGKEKFEVRGECYKDKEDFFENWFGEYTNPRNFTSGALNQKDAKITGERGLSFIAYELLGIKCNTEFEKLQKLDDFGYETVMKWAKVIKPKTVDECVKLVDEYMTSLDRPNLPFDIDGIVVKCNDIEVGKLFGYSNEGRIPKGARAVKYPTEQVEATLLDVEISVGVNGDIHAVGLIKPIPLAGTTVSRVTLHNFKFILDNKLGHGAKILLEKAGDIIPHIARTITPANNARLFMPPSFCPACHGKLKWDENKITVWCHNKNCHARLNAKVRRWIRKTGIKGIGKSTVTTLIQHGLIKEVADLYRLHMDRQDVSRLFGVGNATNYLKAIDKTRSLTFTQIIVGLGIGNVGRMAKDITKSYNNLDSMKKATADDITKIQGFAYKKASIFINDLKERLEEIQSMLSVIDVKSDVKKSVTGSNSNKLSGKSFLFTGTFSVKRDELESMVEQNGGEIKSVSKNLDYLVWDGLEEHKRGKYEKAMKLGVKIIKIEELMSMV